MANSTTNIDTIVKSQASKEVTANAFFDAASPATVYGRRASTSSGPTWGYYGGNVTKSDGTLGQISNGTLTLTASTTNYIVALKSTGVVSVSTTNTNWNNTTDYWRLYSVVVGVSTVSSYTDSRELGKMTGALVQGITAKDEGSTLTSALTSIDFVGSGIAATNSGGAVTVTVSTPSAIEAKDEGSTLTSALASVDFTGDGVTATNVGGAVTVNIPGSGAAAITVKDEGTNLTTSLTSINFIGSGVTATNSGTNVTVTVPGGGGRDALTADRTYYVRTDGSDSNNGLANTSGGAFLTIQKAVDVTCALDMSIYAVTIQCGDATRTEQVALKTYLGSEAPTIIGNTTTPANCLMNVTSGNCFTNNSGRYWKVSGFKLATTTSGNGFSASGGGSKIGFSNINFGACAEGHIYSSECAQVYALTNYTISGAAAFHGLAVENGVVSIGGLTITITGTPAFSGFLYGRKGHFLVQGITFSGSATGPRFNLNLCSTVFANGSGEASYLPGNSAGSKSTGSEWA